MSERAWYTPSGIAARLLSLSVKMMLRREKETDKLIPYIAIGCALFGMTELAGITGTYRIIKTLAKVRKDAGTKGKEKRGMSGVRHGVRH